MRDLYSTRPIPKMKPITALLTTLLALPLLAHAQIVSLKPSDAGMSVEIDGQVFTEYITKEVARPYMYPLIGAAGVNVSREFPMKKDVPGEAMFVDHPHHRSLWFGHSRINEINFWAEYQVFGKQAHSGFSDVKAAGNQGQASANP